MLQKRLQLEPQRPDRQPYLTWSEGAKRATADNLHARIVLVGNRPSLPTRSNWISRGKYENFAIFL